MAKVLQTTQTNLVLEYETGLDKNGKKIIGSHRIKNIAEAISVDDFALVGAALEKLIAFPSTGLIKEVTASVINQ